MIKIKIFISHNMSDSQIAKQFAEHLEKHNTEAVTVSYAAKYRPGENWRSKIEEDLNNSDWLILLHTDRDLNWDFCMFECGFFVRSTKEKSNTRVIPICERREFVSDSVSSYNYLFYNEQGMFNLLCDIYKKDPWAAAPNVSDDILKETAARLAEIASQSSRVERDIPISKSFSIELPKLDSLDHVPNVESAIYQEMERIPSAAVVSGSLGWQTLFGKSESGSDYNWKDLVADWPYRDLYEFLICNMIQKALRDHESPTGTLVKSSQGEIYRLTLRRYELLKDGRRRFFFTAANLDLPFEFPRNDSSTARETLLYHLVNLTWYFRKRIVEKIAERAVSLASTQSRDSAILRRLYDDIKFEINQVYVQSIIRGIETPQDLRRAFAVGTRSRRRARDVKTAESLIEKSEHFRDLTTNLFAAMRRGESGLEDVVAVLKSMAGVNLDWYKVAAKEYASLAAAVNVPSSLDESKRRRANVATLKNAVAKGAGV